MSRRRRLHPQRGVALVFAAISLVASLAALALAIDIGRLYFERRDLQRAANMAALDSARIASGCVEPIRNPEAAANNEARASLMRNVGNDKDLTDGAGLVSLGSMQTDNGVRRFVTGAKLPSAVQVQLARSLPARLIPGTGGDALKLRATAAARAQPVASLSVASGLVSLAPDPLNNLLGGLLGKPLNVCLLCYRGLFTASAKLGDVMAEAHAGTPTEFLAANISAPVFLRALADGLSSGADATTRATLNTLAGAADASRQVTPGTVIGVPPGLEDAASGAVINVGAVAQAVAQAANGQNLLTLPATVNIPGVLSGGSVTARLIETATPVIGSAGDDSAATNAQGLVQINLPLLPIFGSPVNLKLWVQAAQATAQVVEIECARSGQPNPVVHVRARASAARIGLGEFDNINGAHPTPRPAPLVSLRPLGIPITITASAMVDVGQSQDVELIFRKPLPETQSIGGSVGDSLNQATSSLARSLTLEVSPASALLNPVVKLAVTPVLALLASTLTPVLNQVDELLLTPVLAPLGLTLGGADITVQGVSGDQPVLFNR